MLPFPWVAVWIRHDTTIKQVLEIPEGGVSEPDDWQYEWFFQWVCFDLFSFKNIVASVSHVKWDGRTQTGALEGTGKTVSFFLLFKNHNVETAELHGNWWPCNYTVSTCSDKINAWLFQSFKL